MIYSVNFNRNLSYIVKNGYNLEIPFGEQSAPYEKYFKFLEKRGHINPSNEMLDLMDLGILIYYADKYCARLSRQSWCRTFKLKIQLREPERISSFIPVLSYLLTTLSGDNFEFEINGLDTPPPQDLLVAKDPNPINPNCVALFSGGIDSVAGGLKLLADGNRPVFLHISTHDKVPLATFIQEFGRRGKSLLITKDIAQLKLQDGKMNEKEPSQRTRSLFFLIAATFQAYTHGVDKIYVNENGIMGVHIPLDPSRASTFSTRTVYPPFISKLSAVLSQYLNKPNLKLINLFDLSTKSEVIKNFESLNATELLKVTVSCAHVGNLQRLRSRLKHSNIDIQKEDKHCGYCFPCLLRRISVAASGLTQYDVRYPVDAFGAITEPVKYKTKILNEASSAAIGIIRFCHEYSKTPNDKKSSTYQNIIECAAHTSIPGTQPIINMHNTLISEVKIFLKKEYPYYLQFLEDGKDIDSAVDEVLTPENIELLLSFVGESFTPAVERRITTLLRSRKWDIMQTLLHFNLDVVKTNEYLVQVIREELGVMGDDRLPQITNNQLKEIDQIVEKDRCRCRIFGDIIRDLGWLND